MHFRKCALTAIFVALAGSLPAVSQSDTSPLPEIWEWRPLKQPKDWASVTFWKFGDNDILISYSSEEDRPKEHETTTFFGRRRFKNAEAAFGIAPGAILPLPIMGYGSAKLPNGKIIAKYGAHDCNRGLGAGVSVYDNHNNLLTHKSLLLILDKPRRAPDVVCEGMKEKGFLQRLVIFLPQKVVALSDNTFLVSDLATGTILRFDENLNTKSSLFGKTVFVVDPKALEKRIEKYLRGPAEYGVRWEQFFEDLRIEMIRRSK